VGSASVRDRQRVNRKGEEPKFSTHTTGSSKTVPAQAIERFACRCRMRFDRAW
jgi:hypothetical protein